VRACSHPFPARTSVRSSRFTAPSRRRSSAASASADLRAWSPSRRCWSHEPHQGFARGAAAAAQGQAEVGASLVRRLLSISNPERPRLPAARCSARQCTAQPSYAGAACAASTSWAFSFARAQARHARRQRLATLTAAPRILGARRPGSTYFDGEKAARRHPARLHRGRLRRATAGVQVRRSTDRQRHLGMPPGGSKERAAAVAGHCSTGSGLATTSRTKPPLSSPAGSTTSAAASAPSTRRRRC
jgi:hypothetical protein